ncbi:MAG: NADH dehydrogenase [Candidatus Margulisbacteria bacterium GWF2_35_9]|nr:MAG: NADH dehydrogenase [Candidatus Margulisbacteria bacterium GWF2_35_9]
MIIKVGLGTCGIAAGAKEVYNKFETLIGKKSNLVLDYTSCNGMCFHEPIVEIIYPNKTSIMLGGVDVSDVEGILNNIIKSTHFHDHLVIKKQDMAMEGMAFESLQTRLVLKRCGAINPDSIDEYIASDGFLALEYALKNMTPENVVDEVKKSGLRGRGGAGFPTGLKWDLSQKAVGTKKYVICNADEGDPGAFMDRAALEGDPYNIIEGMILCGYAIGAGVGYIYVRAEYPLAVKRVKEAILVAESKHYLGKNILGTTFNFEIKIKEGAGAFVCGEETALIASIEGKRGMPKIKPPFPSTSGLWGCPTNINNVETLATVAWIIRNGSAKYAAMGTEKSKGTKVFSLAGKIKNSGLVEVEMGLTIDQIIYDIGGGTSSGKPVKAVQLGGPSGGCLPTHLLKTLVDYESIVETGAIMGSGGMIVMDEETCMVDIAKYFLTFIQQESCGKCTFCRIGTKRMLEILEKMTEGKGTMDDLVVLRDLCEKVGSASLCQLGKTAPNPILTTLKYFENEYLEHIHEKKCRAKVCKALIRFHIDDNLCNGCTLCRRNCPVNAIHGKPKDVHIIQADICTKCGICFDICPQKAISKESGL